VKHAIIILGGGADEPIEELGGRTPLEAAAMPALARLAEMGRVGTVATVPEGWRATAETTLATIFGHDPARVGFDRGPVEAVGRGIELGSAAAMRLDLLTIGEEAAPEAGLVVRLAEERGSSFADALSPAEAETLLTDLLAHWKHTLGSRAAGLELAAISPRGAIAIDRSGRGYTGVVTAPPTDLLDAPAEKFLPMGGDGEAADFLRELIETGYPLLRDHEINRARTEAGLPAANLAWPWAPGTLPAVTPLGELFSLRGLMLAASPVARGVARIAGLDCLADAATDNLPALGDQACVALDAVDLVAVHLDAPGLAARTHDWAAKTEALEAIDAAIIAPVLETLERSGDAETDTDATGWRMMVLPDRFMLTETGTPDARPVPVAMAGAWIRAAVTRKMNESDAEQSDMHIDPGCELLEYFLRGGLARVR
jgi:2,3-bisphosphoglycerate-independent phosphoglycerate mutase